MTLGEFKDGVLAGTGHRPDRLGGYNAETCARLRKVIGAALDRIKPSAVISGMALGFDTALAQCAMDRSLPLFAAVPFIGQEQLWNASDKLIYDKLLKQATEVKIICPGGYAGWKLDVRNHWMVDHASRLLALWNRSNGGTANCVRYAIKREVPWENIWSEWESDLQGPEDSVW